MSDFLSRLVQHSRGEAATVRPVSHAVTAPDPGGMAWDERVTEREAPPLARSPRALYVPWLVHAKATAPMAPPAPPESSLQPAEAIAAAPLPSDEPERWRTPESPSDDPASPEMFAALRNEPDRTPQGAHFTAAMPPTEASSRRSSSTALASAAARAVGTAEPAIPSVSASLASSSLPPAWRTEPQSSADPARDIQAIAATPSNRLPPASPPLAPPAARANGVGEPAIPQARARLASTPTFAPPRPSKPQRSADRAPDMQAIAAMPSSPRPPSNAPLAPRAPRESGIDPARDHASARPASAPGFLPPIRPPELWRSADSAPSAQAIALATVADKAPPSVSALAPAGRMPNSEALAPAAALRRPAREPEARLQEHSTTVEVSIGRIEVRLPPRPRSAADRAPPPRRAAVGLAEYLSNREAGKTR